MGLFTKSIMILAIAVSIPLLYRQFATDDTIKFMSKYYSNYKVIDSYLRQGANHIDQAKNYLPDSRQMKQVYDKLNKQFNQFINPSDKKGASSTASNPKSDGQDEKQDAHRLTSCPGDESQERLWTKDELTQYDGSHGSELYLGFLGVVYNVTMNAQHYGQGSDYNAFAGHDATRAFVTGNFTHDLHDDIKDIDEQMYAHFDAWSSFYRDSYQSLGRIEGAFYDSRGCPTSELARVQRVFAKLAQDKEKQKTQDRSLPECNTEWNGDLKKGRVWCSPKSGGIEREWAGVPRILEDAQTKRCVCLNLREPDAAQAKNLGLYPGCDPEASECPVQDAI